MGADQRTITADKAMLDKTSWALSQIPADPSNASMAKNDIEDPGTRLGVATEPGWGTA
jgi:hypothetical protein